MLDRLLVIPGTLPGLNEYIAAERTNRYKAAAMKREAESLVLWAAKQHLRGWKARGPVRAGPPRKSDVRRNDHV